MTAISDVILCDWTGDAAWSACENEVENKGDWCPNHAAYVVKNLHPERRERCWSIWRSSSLEGGYTDLVAENMLGDDARLLLDLLNRRR